MVTSVYTLVTLLLTGQTKMFPHQRFQIFAACQMIMSLGNLARTLVAARPSTENLRKVIAISKVSPRNIKGTLTKSDGEREGLRFL
jgi:hypothetical protein